MVSNVKGCEVLIARGDNLVKLLCTNYVTGYYKILICLEKGLRRSVTPAQPIFDIAPNAVVIGGLIQV